MVERWRMNEWMNEYKTNNETTLDFIRMEDGTHFSFFNRKLKQYLCPRGKRCKLILTLCVYIYIHISLSLIIFISSLVRIYVSTICFSKKNIYIRNSIGNCEDRREDVSDHDFRMNLWWLLCFVLVYFCWNP